MAVKLPTKYNSYDYEKDPHKLFPPRALASMARWDAKVESEFSRSSESNRSEDAIERQRRYAREYGRRHAAERSAYGREYRERNRERISAQRKARYWREKAAREGGSTP